MIKDKVETSSMALAIYGRICEMRITAMLAMSTRASIDKFIGRRLNSDDLDIILSDEPNEYAIFALANKMAEEYFKGKKTKKKKDS